jgi:hypothetical protein
MTSFTVDNLRYKASANQQVEDAISYYQSPEKRRIALRKALAASPDDARLHQYRLRLTSAKMVAQAMDAGVFLSYSRADELFVIELADHLREVGVQVWLDMMDIEADFDWNFAVQSALTNCGLMIAVLSPDALKDEAARSERRTFFEAGKLVQPVVARRCDLTGVDFWLSPIDFSRDYTVGLHTLLRALSIEVF